jgi:restriction endonuclease S subunit
LEGLEVTIINKSDLERTKRVDAEFYSKENLNVISKISKLNPKPVTDFFRVSDGNHMTISDQFSQDGIPYYRGGDIYNFFIENTAQPLTIPESIYNWPNLKRSHLQKGDVLVSIVGAIIGNLSLVTTNQKATCSCKLAILRPTKIKPQFAAIYFKTKFGQNQIQKFRRGSGQTGLILEDFDQLLIPEISDSFCEVIVAFVEQANQKIEKSIHAYQNAETCLLETIGLKNFKPSSDTVNIKSFKDSFGISGRLDAEYYQKKYEEVLLSIENNTNWKYLKDITTYISNGNQPPYTESGTIKFFSQKWIGDKSIDYSFLKSDEEPLVDSSFFDEEKNRTSLVTKGDILYYSVGANLGYCHNYLAEDPIAVGSFINIIRADMTKINEIYLGVVMNSIVGRLQAEKEKSGMAQPYIYAKSLRAFKIPIVTREKQTEISECIEIGMQAKKQSEHLLEVAKKAVEMAIEEGEERAMEWMAANTVSYQESHSE